LSWYVLLGGVAFSVWLFTGFPFLCFVAVMLSLTSLMGSFAPSCPQNC
jgi:hypothetical protein